MHAVGTRDYRYDVAAVVTTARRCLVKYASLFTLSRDACISPRTTTTTTTIATTHVGWINICQRYYNRARAPLHFPEPAS